MFSTQHIVDIVTVLCCGFTRTGSTVLLRTQTSRDRSGSIRILLTSQAGHCWRLHWSVAISRSRRMVFTHWQTASTAVEPRLLWNGQPSSNKIGILPWDHGLPYKWGLFGRVNHVTQHVQHLSSERLSLTLNHTLTSIILHPIAWLANLSTQKLRIWNHMELPMYLDGTLSIYISAMDWSGQSWSTKRWNCTVLNPVTAMAIDCYGIG